MTANEIGVVGTLQEDGYPVIYALDLDSPAQSEIDAFPWLLIISWKYDREIRNGMPPSDMNDRMLLLEDALEANFLKSAGARWAYNRTGNGLKQFAFYVRDPSKFIDRLNHALKAHQRYPIDIKFYDDAAWEDYLELVEIFGDARARNANDA